MDYPQFYDLVTGEIRRLKAQDILSDYRLCKALAACYEPDSIRPWVYCIFDKFLL